MTHIKARFWATSLGLSAAIALTGCGAMTAAPQPDQGNDTPVAAPTNGTTATTSDTATGGAPSATGGTTENPAPAVTTDANSTTTPVSSAPSDSLPAPSAPTAAPPTGEAETSTPAVSEAPVPPLATPSPPTTGAPVTEAPAAPSVPATETPVTEVPAAPSVPGGYPVVAAEDSPQVGLDSNGKYPPHLRLAAMDQGRLFFAYPKDWDVIAGSDTSLSIRTPDGSIEGGIDVREAGPGDPDLPEMTNTRTVYGQAQGPNHAASVVVGRTSGPFGTDRLSWRLQDPNVTGYGMALGDGRVVDIQLYAIVGDGNPPLTDAQIEQQLDAIETNPEHLAAQNILGTVHYVG